MLDESLPMFPPPLFFKDAKLNFAENLLFPPCSPDETSFAIIAASEDTREYVTWRDLRQRVKQCRAAMVTLDIKPGERVAGYVANHTNAVVAMLSATSIGALWTAVSPDTGVHAVLDRMRQVEPVILFVDNAAKYNGKVHEVQSKVQSIAQNLPNLKRVIIFETVPNHSTSFAEIPVAQNYTAFLSAAHTNSSEPMPFAHLPPDHPVFILYSSGTTGAPKCIVHGAAGTLVQHKKEHDIHCDIRPGDRVFYFTTCTWMMWHWLVSALASGATIILYDGSPFCPSDNSALSGELVMPRLIDELRITHFGTSAKYLSILEQKKIFPREADPPISLRTLKAIYSTSSPLAPSTFKYVYAAFGPDVHLGSITGGTDIISLFGAPCPLVPVHAGEIQCLGLGMAVEAWDSIEGKPLTGTAEPGDLVCVKPFPCQPVCFWGADGENKYRRSYFETFPRKEGVWHHGDFIKINPTTGGMMMLGRSDGVLKPAGVRFGSSEIYNVLLKNFPTVEDALCVGRRREEESDEVVVLFLKMIRGEKISDDLVKKVKRMIREELSARHVPGIVDECPEIPVTANGKKCVPPLSSGFL